MSLSRLTKFTQKIFSKPFDSKKFEISNRARPFDSEKFEISKLPTERETFYCKKHQISKFSTEREALQ